ncbi:MAG: hypothetical protein KTR31_39160 [Myxococcales bacterium]|nr:hypothetical protein [Myxococcales bacterium]
MARRRPIDAIRLSPEWTRRDREGAPSRPHWSRPDVVPEAVELPEFLMSSEGVSEQLSEDAADALSAEHLRPNSRPKPALGTVVHEPTGEYDALLTDLPPDDSIVGEFVDHPFLNGLGVAADTTGEWDASPTEDTDFVQQLPSEVVEALQDLDLQPPNAPRLRVAGASSTERPELEVPPPPARWTQDVPDPVRPGNSAVGRHEALELGQAPRALPPLGADQGMATIQPVPTPGRRRPSPISEGAPRGLPRRSATQRSHTQPGSVSSTVPSRLSPIPVQVELEEEPRGADALHSLEILVPPEVASWHSLSELDSLDFQMISKGAPAAPPRTDAAQAGPPTVQTEATSDEILLGAPIRPVNQLQPAPLHVGGPPLSWLEEHGWVQESPSEPRAGSPVMRLLLVGGAVVSVFALVGAALVAALFLFVLG